ncbi:hypothetical protein SAMN05192529_102290 [Arachidicoccus rhizosphaerae]|uniref:GYF domain-containing protein n=1 Tax=Arachidicoccus rhizosphaerae TaxID=551991 RepID=A0A1H3WBB5_9BACT|nr:FxLYD domain-containing protein [Arachidicoccus rhizosphaerae]SDZ84403.1 hypothetical protein SAMN05192529_102290 [Arachidicoccus rhizosphaerae]
MQYWLRRNNIDKGPLTKEALLSQGLQTTDLIKIDGSSEWKSLTDFPELMTASQSQPKPKYKFTADKQLIEIKEAAKNADTAQKTDPAAAPQKGAAAQSQPNSPFKRMPSALPKKKTTYTPPADHTQVQSTEKAKERAKITTPLKGSPAEGSTAAGNANSSSHHHSASASDHGQKIQARVQSLDDAPLREVRHHPTPKPVRAVAPPRNSHFFKEFFLPIIIIGGIGFLAWWGYKQFTSPSANLGNLSGADSLTLIQQKSGTPSDSASQKSNLAEGPAAIPVKTGSAEAPVHKDSLAGAKSTPVLNDSSKAVATSVKTAAPMAATPPPAKTTRPATDSPQAATDLAATKTATPVAPPKQEDSPATANTNTAKKEPEKKVEKKAPVKKAAAIGDYVDLSLNKTPEAGIKNVKIKVHNTSSDDLNIAVVEIKYFDKDGKFVQGETLQTGKIGAGKSATLKVPSSKNAEKISYKVSLISGDNVYLMGK